MESQALTYLLSVAEALVPRNYFFSSRKLQNLFDRKFTLLRAFPNFLVRDLAVQVKGRRNADTFDELDRANISLNHVNESALQIFRFHKEPRPLYPNRSDI